MDTALEHTSPMHLLLNPTPEDVTFLKAEKVCARIAAYFRFPDAHLSDNGRQCFKFVRNKEWF